MKKAIALIETLIKEHEENEYCTNYDEAQNELDPERAIFLAYDCGRYEAFTYLLNELKQLN